MSIHHHLNEATLMAYAAGTLPESMNLVIATHLSQCPVCRKKVGEMEEMGAGSLENVPGLAMRSDALDQIMTLLDADEKPKAFHAA
ncbi:MAG: zf-HC2 domain-containing protein, partial [Sneathiella sp.]